MRTATNKTFTRHKLEQEQFKICCNNITLERVSEKKLVGVSTDENLTQNKHGYCQKTVTHIWNKVFKNGPSEICGIQPLKI